MICYSDVDTNTPHHTNSSRDVEMKLARYAVLQHNREEGKFTYPLITIKVKWQGTKLLILLRHWYRLELIILCNHQNSKFHKWYNIVVVLTKNGFQACIILSNIGFLIHRKSHKNLSTLAFLICTVVTYRKLCILAFSPWILCTASFQVFVIHISKYISGAPNFRKISVRKTIWDLEFSEHLL